MDDTLSRRLDTLATGFAHAADTGARLSPTDARTVIADLHACSALARDLEIKAWEAELRSDDARMFGRAHDEVRA